MSNPEKPPITFTDDYESMLHAGNPNDNNSSGLVSLGHAKPYEQLGNYQSSGLPGKPVPLTQIASGNVLTINDEPAEIILEAVGIIPASSLPAQRKYKNRALYATFPKIAAEKKFLNKLSQPFRKNIAQVEGVAIPSGNVVKNGSGHDLCAASPVNSEWPSFPRTKPIRILRSDAFDAIDDYITSTTSKLPGGKRLPVLELLHDERIYGPGITQAALPRERLPFKPRKDSDYRGIGRVVMAFNSIEPTEKVLDYRSIEHPSNPKLAYVVPLKIAKDPMPSDPLLRNQFYAKEFV